MFDKKENKKLPLWEKLFVFARLMFLTLMSNIDMLMGCYRQNYHKNPFVFISPSWPLMSNEPDQQNVLVKIIPKIEAGELSPDDFSIATIYRMSGQNNKALYYYEKALTQESLIISIGSYFNIGLIQEEKENIDAAKKAFAKVIELSDRDDRFGIQSAIAKIKTNDFLMKQDL